MTPQHSIPLQVIGHGHVGLLADGPSVKAGLAAGHSRHRVADYEVLRVEIESQELEMSFGATSERHKPISEGQG